MKNYIIGLILMLSVSNCINNNIVPNKSIVGVWLHSYQQQTLNQDGTWSTWQTISTLVAMPSYEFTKSGKFLLDGKISETCCLPGCNYIFTENILKFTYQNPPDCSMVKCTDANIKIVEILDEKSLILIESSGRVKYKYTRKQ